MQIVTEKSLKRSRRIWGDMLRIWRLCGRTACRRAHGCRGDANACFAANFPLLPEGVQDWLAGMAQAQADGIDFDEAVEELDALPEGEAFRAWCEAVEKAS